MNGGAGQSYFSILIYCRRQASSHLALLQAAVTDTRPREWKERSEAQGSYFPPFLISLLQGKFLGLGYESPVEKTRKKTAPVTPPFPSTPSLHNREDPLCSGRALSPAFSLQSQQTDLEGFFVCVCELRFREYDNIETVKA